MDDISIDRLVLDIPGLTVEAAQDLALRIGEGLAAGSNVSGSFDTLAVDLGTKPDPEKGAADTTRLANMIVGLLLQQMN